MCEWSFTSKPILGSRGRVEQPMIHADRSRAIPIAHDEVKLFSIESMVAEYQSEDHAGNETADVSEVCHSQRSHSV